jgi:sarcosine oxidase subunit alpha
MNFLPGENRRTAPTVNNRATSRLPEPWGSAINRDRTISFQFEGKDYQGYEGDTLASALAANGQWLLSRSFKYHRPRAAITFAGLDANTYVQVGDAPNALADMLPVSEGLGAVGQNYLGSLNRDHAVHAGHLSRFLPVGFYYRAFFRPQGIWPLWERFFRRVAGLGKINRNAAASYFDKQYLFADVAIIGGGPAGLSAALSAADAGATVLLIEEAAMLGGSLNYARFQQDRSETQSLRDDLVGRVEKNDNIRILAGATCSGWFADNWLAISTSNRLYKLRAKYVIACTGSVEQAMVFRNNDLPGVLPASGVQRYARSGHIGSGSHRHQSVRRLEPR